MCIAIAEEDAEKAREAADACFAYEISLGKLNPLKVETGFSIVCLIGDDILGHSGATGRMLAALGAHSIPVRATAQGSSERNISVIVPSVRAEVAIRAIHREFFDKWSNKVIHLFIAGYGRVGKALVEMLSENAASIAKRSGKKPDDSVGHHRGGYLSAGENKISDTELPCDEMVTYALVNTFIVTA
jgi:aspartokinase/homoserine dehydrogenase 1